MTVYVEICSKKIMKACEKALACYHPNSHIFCNIENTKEIASFSIEHGNGKINLSPDGIKYIKDFFGGDDE